jgi:triacylglycerol lipase
VYYNATEYGYDCPAYGSDTTTLVNQGLVHLNEDCLNLNIIRPKGNGETLPVMLWVYGGGWQQGATADPRYVSFRCSFLWKSTLTLELGWLANRA